MEVSVIESGHRDLNIDFIAQEKEKKWYHKVLSKFYVTGNELNLFLTKLFVLFFLCACLYGLVHKEAMPGSQIFSLLLLAVAADLGGKLVELVKIPSLVGMMMVGFMYRNIKFIPYYYDISKNTISCLRQVALAYILMRSGLGLDATKLNEMKYLVARLTLIPCFVEAAAIAVIGHFLLDLPYIFSVMLGFVISAISPAVVVPVLLKLEEKGYGVKKGIPTIIMAAASLDDVLAIFGFTVAFSIAFSDENLTWTIIKGPLEPMVGFAFGAVFGVIYWHFPSPKIDKNHLVLYNVVLLSLSCIANMSVSERIGIAGAGPLGCIVIAFVAALKWRENIRQFKGIYAATGIVWDILNPFLFSLIGAELTVSSVGESAGYGTLLIICGLLCRMCASIVCCYGGGLNWKEKFFVTCAWLPKATVQAAIGSHALDYARNKFPEKPEFINYGYQVLTVAVLSIILTAPLGAALTSFLGPILLAKEESEVSEPSLGANSYGSCDQRKSTDSLGVHQKSNRQNTI